MTIVPETRRFRRRRGVRHPQRRAIVAVVVLLLIAVALASSYSAMRSQSITLNVRQNAALGVSARQAAMTGLAAGYREMHSPDWSGTSTTFTRWVGANARFEVEYISGDATLAAGDPEYDEFPYRVTLAVVGIVTDPTDPRRASRHSIRAVARLIPRAMPAEPSNWSAMQRYTFYQTDIHDTTLDLPCRIEGTICLQGRLRLAEHYPNDWDAWVNYLYHQDQMRLHGFDDIRVLTGRVDFPYGYQDWYVFDTLINYMSVPTQDRAPAKTNADWLKPAYLTTYRLFPGGKPYEIPRISGLIANKMLAASLADNPLGLFYANDNVTLGNHVTVRGTLFCRDTIAVTGTNVRFESVEIPPVLGTSLPIRLPVATCRNFTVKPGSSCTVDGLLAAFGRVEVERGSPRGRLDLRGRIVAEDLHIREEDDWLSVNWAAQFQAYVQAIASSWSFLPEWMSVMGYDWAPTVHIQEGKDVRYHWYRPDATVFIPNPVDFSEMDGVGNPGLRWELIEIAHEAN